MLAAAHIDLQAWLHTVAGTRPPVVVPYVKSPSAGTVHYTVTVVKQGSSGFSRINQSGEVAVHADQPTALSQFSVDARPGDNCNIELTVSVDKQQPETMNFECPR